MDLDTVTVTVTAPGRPRASIMMRLAETHWLEPRSSHGHGHWSPWHWQSVGSAAAWHASGRRRPGPGDATGRKDRPRRGTGVVGVTVRLESAGLA